MLAPVMGVQGWDRTVREDMLVWGVFFELLAARLSEDGIQLSLVSQCHL